MLVYIAVFIFHFLVIEYRYFCSHCPNYGNSQGTTQCMFLWWIPRFFKPRPGPLSVLDRTMMLFGLAVMLLFPIYWLVFHLVLFVFYVLFWAILFINMKRYECPRCIYFHYPANSVPQEFRDSYNRKKGLSMTADTGLLVDNKERG
jgi:hypothetical protein